jgi:hypothetical protein
VDPRPFSVDPLSTASLIRSQVLTFSQRFKEISEKSTTLIIFYDLLPIGQHIFSSESDIKNVQVISGYGSRQKSQLIGLLDSDP